MQAFIESKLNIKVYSIFDRCLKTKLYDEIDL